jgi:septum formation protein
LLILASSSPTRAKILNEFGIEFIQKSCDFDEESLKFQKPEYFVYHAAKGKLLSCEKKFTLKTPILVADTIVAADSKILRKAYTKDEAKKILNIQSGNTVSILTCMIYKSSSFVFTDLSSTDYVFDKFDEDDLNSYLDSGEWKGKAGACMVEGFCKKYIKEIRGLESCARGLQIEKLLPFIR